MSGAVVAVSRNETYAFSKPVRQQILLVAGLGVEGDAHAGVTVKHRSRIRADPSQPNLRQVHLLAAELLDEVREQGYEVTPGQLGENVTTRGIDLLRLPRGAILRFGPPPTPRPSPACETVQHPVDREMVGAGESGPEGAGMLAGIFTARKANMSAATAAALAAVTAAAARDGGRPPEECGPRQRHRPPGRRDGDRGPPDPRPAVIVAGLRNPCGQINGLHPGLLKCVLGQDEDGNPVRKAGVMGVVLRGGLVRPGDPVTVDLPPAPHLPLERV